MPQMPPMGAAPVSKTSELQTQANLADEEPPQEEAPQEEAPEDASDAGKWNKTAIPGHLKVLQMVLP